MPQTEAPLEIFDSSPESSHSGDTPDVLHNPRIQHLNARPRVSVEGAFLRPSEIEEIELENVEGLEQAYLLPLNLPNLTEPTLDELLRRVTGRQDIQNVDSVKLRVISYMVSLCRLSLFMPRLVHLDLSGSVLNSLRDLGCGLIHLTHLNVSNCGLSSFDGTSGIPNVEVLIADGNMVQLVGPLADLPMLKKLSMRNNGVRDLGMLSFLGMCPNLIELELEGNPVTSVYLYRRSMQRNVPTLELLDGRPFAEASLPGPSKYGDDTTDGESSLSDEIYSDRETSLVSIASPTIEDRPSTSGGLCNIAILTLNERPASCTSVERKPSLQSSLVVGSVLGIARDRKKSKGFAWGSSSTSSTSSSSLDLRREFPMRVPRTTLPPLFGEGTESPQNDDRSISAGSNSMASSFQEEVEEGELM